MDSYDNAITDREMLERSQTAPVTTSLDGENLINIEDITARIADLEASDCGEPDREDDPMPHIYGCPTCDEYTGEELTALRELLAEMEPVKACAGRASAIRDSYMDTFSRDEIEDICGSDAVAILSPYVDWDRLTANRQDKMTETTFLSTTYYITS